MKRAAPRFFGRSVRQSTSKDAIRLVLPGEALYGRVPGQIGHLGHCLLGMAVVVIALGTGEPARALECPVPETQNNQHVLRETQAQIKELSELLASGDVANRLGVIVRGMRQKYPAVTDAELVNYFLTAYCPDINAMDGLSEDEKKTQLEQFSSQVFQAVEQ